MSRTVDELKPFKVYSDSQKLYLPITETDKQHGSIIFLMAPNHESALKTMQLPYLVNKRYFESYYTEKDINLIINHESGVLESYVNEASDPDSILADILGLNEKLNGLKYGYYVNKQKVELKSEEDWATKYQSQNPNNLITNGGGTCWDFTGYEALYLKKHFPSVKFDGYFIELENGSAHVFIILELGGKYYYFESSFKSIAGLYEADSKKNIFNFVLKNMYKYDKTKLPYVIYKFDPSNKKLYDHLINSEYVDMVKEIGTKVHHRYNSNAKDLEKLNMNDEDRLISNISPNYKPKGYKSLSDFKTVPLTKENIKKYVKDADIEFIKNKDFNGVIFIDDENNFVSVFNTRFYDKNNTNKTWVSGLEVAKKYRGYGLAKQTMQYAIDNFGGTRLSVDDKNKVAIKLYQDMGFHAYHKVPGGYWMTIEKDMPRITINESVDESSDLDPNYKPKEHINLSKFKRIPFTTENIKKYVKGTKLHFKKYDSNTKGAIWIDSDDKFVAAVNTCYFKDDAEEFGDYLKPFSKGNNSGATWISNMEVANKYKGHGLSKQVLKYATTQLGATRLGVDPKNKIAIKVYEDCGFHIFVSKPPYFYWMTTEKDLKKSTTTNESRLLSDIDSNYKSKGHKSLSEFKAIPMTVQNVKKYASHTQIDFSGDYKMNGTIWVDKNDNFVAIVNTAYYDKDGHYNSEIDTTTYTKKDGGASWITGMEIAEEYRGYGLSKQILKYAMDKFHVTRLDVDKKNKVALKTYKDMGFHIYKEKKTTYKMTTEKDVPEIKNINESIILDSKHLTAEEIKKNPDYAIKLLKSGQLEPEQKFDLSLVMIPVGILLLLSPVTFVPGMAILSATAIFYDKLYISFPSKAAKESKKIVDVIDKELANNSIDPRAKQTLLRLKADMSKIDSEEKIYKSNNLNPEMVNWYKKSLQSYLNKDIKDIDYIEDVLEYRAEIVYAIGITASDIVKIGKRNTNDKYVDKYADYLDKDTKEYAYFKDKKLGALGGDAGGNDWLYCVDDNSIYYFDHEESPQIDMSQKFTPESFIAFSKKNFNANKEIQQALKELKTKDKSSKSISESSYSKGVKSLMAFTRYAIPGMPKNIFYKDNNKLVKHTRMTDNCRGYLYVNDESDVIAIVNTETKPNNEIWIETLEVAPNYQGYGLGKQLLEVATKKLHAEYVSVVKNNTKAISMYKKYGFHEYKTTDSMIFMTTRYKIIESHNQSDILHSIEKYKNKNVVFHGSSVQNLKYIKGRESRSYPNFGKCVFATKYPNMAACFILQWHGDNLRLGTNPDSSLAHPSYWFIDDPTTFDMHIPGSIYVLSGNGFKEIPNHPNECVHEGDVKVLDEMQFDSIQNALKLFNVEYYDYNTKKMINENYETPYTADEIKINYGIDTYDKLSQDPAHKFRMDTGIELIHQEPSLKELNRIWKNWNRMSADNKKISDQKSIELFGVDNKTHYKKLISKYTINEDTLSSKEKKSFDNSVYGLPKQKKYPMPDAAHVRSAISYFHRCPKNNKKELAKNIKKKAKEFGVEINPDTLVYKYIHEAEVGLQNTKIQSNLTDYIPINPETVQELQQWMYSNIKYKEFTKLMTPQEVYETKSGSCHDQALFAKEELKRLDVVPNLLFFIEYNSEEQQGGMTHMLVYFKKDNKIWWLENAWDEAKGLRSYNSLSELKSDIINRHNKMPSSKRYPKLEFSNKINLIPGMDLSEIVNNALN